ncbi:YibE/F family protein [Candidatus Nomurabacteria bacterium]|nr:YibE/F family protein [Candidatus Nomurabacteria bacterium]
MKKILAIIIFIFIFLPFVSEGQEIQQELQGLWKAKVIEVSNQEEKIIPGTNTKTEVQYIKVQILEGEKKDEVVEFENDYIILKEGQKFFLNYLKTISGQELYSVRDVDRRVAIAFLAILFASVVLIFGKWQGFRSLISLVGSFLVIVYVLLPLLIKGYNPIVTSILIGSLILFVAIFFTHGFKMSSVIAYGGTVLTILITGILANLSIKILSLSGFFSDETTYLNFSTGGMLDFQGLLLGGIIIGVLGVLDDIAITQVAVVHEIKSASEKISKKVLYEKAIRVGREHVSALVNTIVLAYAGVSLPLLLWFSQSEASFGTIINNEIFSTEIARTIVGSIGLILTVPVTTFLAVWFSDKLKEVEGHNHHHH